MPSGPVTRRSVPTALSATSNVTVNVLSNAFATLRAPRGIEAPLVLLIAEVWMPLTVTVPVRAYGPKP